MSLPFNVLVGEARILALIERRLRQLAAEKVAELTPEFERPFHDPSGPHGTGGLADFANRAGER